MEGDLSLSQSFGGLRIANPDDSLGTSEHNNDDRDATPGQSQRQPSGGLADLPSTVPAPNSSVHPSSSSSSVSQSHPYPYQDQQHYHNSPRIPPTNLPSQDLDVGAPAPSARPSSTYLTSWSPNDPASTPATRPASHRMRAESGASSASDNMVRSDSRPLQQRPSVRDGHSTPRSDTQYVQGSPGQAPPRRSSRMVAASSGASPLSGSPYSADGAPLSAAAAAAAASGEDWHERGAAVGLRQEVDPSGKTVSRYIKKGVRDFSFGRTLGEGSYSTVIAGTDRQTLREYAIKMLDKRHIIKEKKVKYVNIEKDTLNRLTDHPGVVRLYYTFQDERSLYFVLDLANGGELLGVLKRMQTFDEECTRFYGAQILDTVDYMHKRGVIHRDLKPENVLLDSHMHVKITDFGTAKILDPPPRRPQPTDNDNTTGAPIPQVDGDDVSLASSDRARSFVGTAEYVSPELLQNESACKASDLWAFGCIIFQLLAGRPPFKSVNDYQTFQKIVALDYEFPRGFPPVARDLVERLLVLDPASRLQMEHIKNHEFFDGITWGRGLWKQKAPRLKPYVPPPPEPIKLNGGSNMTADNGDGSSYPPDITKGGPMPPPASAPNASASNVATNRPYPRVTTDLPPPSQLDIEWSPVLTRSNERILKLGNLIVTTSSLPSGSHKSGGNGEGEAPKKLSRFFGAPAAKRRARLVIITSSGRVVVVAAGGEDKKPKLDISLLAPESQYRSVTDAKGHASWVLDSRDKRYVFEEQKSSGSSSADGASARNIQEWIDALDRAKETAVLYATPKSGFPNDYDSFHSGLPSGVSSHSNTLNQSDELSSLHNNNNHYNSSSNKNSSGVAVNSSGRNALVKHHHHQTGGNSGGGAGDSESTSNHKGRKRFSRRHSKNGLSAIF